jgi:hypothetical protein
MSEEVFADGILGVGFGKGAVRIDFFALSAETTDAKGQPAKERRQRIVMTTEGFIDAYAMLSGVMEKLQAQGLLRRLDPGAAASAKGGEAPAPVSGSPSPNF